MRLTVLLVCNVVIWSPFRFRKGWSIMVVMFLLRRYQTSRIHDVWNYIICSLIITCCGLCAPSFTCRLGRYTSWRVHFMCINIYGADRGPFDLPFGDLMKKEGFSGILIAWTRRPLFNISSLPPAPRISMEYNVLIFSLGNLMILLIEEKYLLFFFFKQRSLRFLRIFHAL